jgi:hypothetical protein
MPAAFRLPAAVSAGLASLAWAAAPAAAAAQAAPATAPALATAPASRPAAAPLAAPAVPPAVARPAAAATRSVAATRPAVAAKPGAEPLPSMDEFKSMFDEGKFPDLLKQLPRALVLRGKAAEPYNRYDLLMLRFETHLRMKAQAPAVATLNEAQNVTDDPKKVNYCKAVAILLKRSKNFAYQPSPTKKEKPPAIDVVDPDTRRKALQALLADELAAVMPRVEKALDGQSLAGIAVAIEALAGFDVLESAAGGGDEASRLIGDLRSRGNALMAKTVLRLTTRVDQIAKDAGTLQQYTVRLPDGAGGFTDVVRHRKRGLANGEYQELGEVMKTCDQVIPNARGLARATGGKVQEVEDLIAAAEDLRRKADKTRQTNYNDL